jgi:membrane protein
MLLRIAAEDRWSDAHARLHDRLSGYLLYRVLVSIAIGFRKDRVASHAAAMAYYGIFSLVPLMLLAMALAGAALQSSDFAREQVTGVVFGLLPEGQDALRKVISEVIQAKGTAAGLGAVTLLSSAYVWFQEFDANVNEIWGVSRPRSLFHGLLLPVALAGSVGGVALTSFVATAGISLAARLTGFIPGSVWLWQTVVSLLSALTMACVFFLLYRLTPQRRVHFSDVWPAALAAAALWEVSRRGLALYLQTTNLISGYGPLGAAMALLVWFYVGGVIILTGAECAYALAKERRHVPLDEELPVIAPAGEQPTPKFAPQVGRELGT